MYSNIRPEWQFSLYSIFKLRFINRGDEKICLLASQTSDLHILYSTRTVVANKCSRYNVKAIDPMSGKVQLIKTLKLMM